MAAVEVSGTIERNHIRLDTALPISTPKRVRVLVMYNYEGNWNEAEWLQAAAHNPAFDFLNDPAEDIYSLSDGKAWHDDIMQAQVNERPRQLFNL